MMIGMHLRQNVAQDDAAVARADGPRPRDVLALLDGQRLRAHQPRRVRPAEDGDHEDDFGQTAPPDGDDHQRQRQVGDDEQEIDDAHEQVVDFAAEISGDQPDARADNHGHERGGEADQQRDARAVDQLAEDILPGVVCAEQMRGAGRGEDVAGLHLHALHRGRRARSAARRSPPAATIAQHDRADDRRSRLRKNCAASSLVS